MQKEIQLETPIEARRQTTPADQNRQRRKHMRTGILFMAPALLVTLVFMIGPALWSVYISLTNMSLTGTGAAAPQWVGLQNFAQILRDGEFLNAFRVSLTYLVFSALIGQAVLGLLLALLMRKRNRIFKAILGSIIGLFPKKSEPACLWSRRGSEGE